MNPALMLDLREKLPQQGEYGKREITAGCFFGIHHVGMPPLGRGIEHLALRTADYHVLDKGWPAIGYHYMVAWPSGECAYVGDLWTARASIWGQNQLTIGICMEGDWSHEEPPLAMLEGVKCCIYDARREAAKREADLVYMDGLSIYGHREKALPGHGTICPGDGGLRLVNKLRRTI